MTIIETGFASGVHYILIWNPTPTFHWPDLAGKDWKKKTDLCYSLIFLTRKRFIFLYVFFIFDSFVFCYLLGFEPFWGIHESGYLVFAFNSFSLM